MLEEPYFHSWRQTNAHGSDIRTRILWRCKLLHVHTGSGDSCRRLMQKKKGKKAKRSNKKGNLIRNSSLSNFSVWSGHKGLFLRNVLVPNSAFLFTFLSQTVAIWDECFTMCHSERNKFFHYCLVRVQLLANVIKTCTLRSSHNIMSLRWKILLALSSENQYQGMRKIKETKKCNLEWPT